MSEQSPPIDHEAIRAIGNTMAEHIGALTSEEVDRDSTIALLNGYVEQVPYGALSDEYLRLTRAIGVIESQHQAIDDGLSTELQRLDGLVATIALKKPKQVDSARVLASRKKDEAMQAAELRKAPLEEPRTLLNIEYEQLTATIESVATAWPAPPYSEEAKQAVQDRQRLLEAEDEDREVTEISDAERLRDRARQLASERVLGPYAKLAAAIPSLSERLSRPVSKHIHVYEGVETAKVALDKATEIPPAERSETEDLLCKAVFVLRRRFLMDPDDLSFLKVYEPADVIELTKRLNKFSRKNRPDFNELEGQILDKAAARIPLRGGTYVPEDIKGAVGRMTEDAPGRTGMTWHSLAKHANRACDTMRYRFFAGGAKNEHLKNYVIDVADRSDTKPDISWIYQFIADDFAFDVLASRTEGSQATAKERFMENCVTITAWQEECRQLLEQLPGDFRLKRQETTRKRNYRTRQRKAVYENVTAYTSIMNTISDIAVRRDGTGDSKVFRHKPVDFDPSGALNHQLRLGHLIDLLKEELAYYDAPTEGYTEEITPFE